MTNGKRLNGHKGGVELMEFTDSQKDFILDSLTTEITKKEKHIKYWTDKAEKENDIQIKNSIRRSIEYAVEKLEELEEMMRIINE